MEETKVATPISSEDALKLLFKDFSDRIGREDCFDRFGNYIYPTDCTVDPPNIAIGSSSGFGVLDFIDINKRR